QSLDVKPAPANHDWEFFARMNLADLVKRELSKFFRVHLFQDRHRADEMMRNFGQRCRVRLCREQIESAINLKRVRADNFATKFHRSIGRDFRFAARGWADNEEDPAHNKMGDARSISASSPDQNHKLRLFVR